jgi:predicted RNase H-like HicB family nuclease
MSVDEKLWEKAETLSSRGYDIETFEESLTNGDIVIVARNPELPGCLAHGTTHDEAITNLSEARTEYIYSLLEDGLPVPLPRGNVINTVVSNNTVIERKTVVGFGTKVTRVLDADQMENEASYLYRGDFVKEA